MSRLERSIPLQFSKLPIRQLMAGLEIGDDSVFSKLPIRQLIAQYDFKKTVWLSKLPIRQLILLRRGIWLF